MKRLSAWIEKCKEQFNDMSLKSKLYGLYIFCVLVPLIVTDGVIFYSLIRAEQAAQQHEMESQASSVQYNISSFVENSSTLAKSFYMNDYVRDFLDTQYDNALDYVIEYQKFMRNSLLGSNLGVDNTKITICADNETIVNGGGFRRLSEVSDTPWYRQLKESSLNAILLFYYDDLNVPYEKAERKVLFLRKLNRFLRDDTEKLLKIEIDYGGLERNIRSMNYENSIYICRGDELLFSNAGANNVGQPFEAFTLADQVGYQKDFTLYGEKLSIRILRGKFNLFEILWDHIPMIVLLLLINIILPWTLMRQIGRSVTQRIGRLSRVFEQVGHDTLARIANIDGHDEIGSLMENYNRMADRMNGLIQTVYKDRLREQEINIARQSAELRALHSQINPHFLFNALESIRMHSILKEEFETAGMVEKLAVMERQTVDWTSDTGTVGREMEFVEAYLELQKYRFGERLSYRLEVEEACREQEIPRLTVTTLAENACVHGIESKTTPGWIFVRVYRDGQELCIEVEDTGGGIEEDELQELQYRMDHASIGMLKEKGHVGVVNVCLRLRMMTGDRAKFLVESEKGIGTTVSIRMPFSEDDTEKDITEKKNTDQL